MDVSTNRAGPAVAARTLASRPAIEARGLRKTYGGRTAVEGLDLEVARGTVLGFLGPNGAGNSKDALPLVAGVPAGVLLLLGLTGVRRRLRK